MLLKHLPIEFDYHTFSGTYAQALAEVRDAFGRALQECEANIPGDKLRAALREAISQLCDPDPLLRGHPLNRRGVANHIRLERFVSLFNLLARRAEIGILEMV